MYRYNYDDMFFFFQHLILRESYDSTKVLRAFEGRIIIFVEIIGADDIERSAIFADGAVIKFVFYESFILKTTRTGSNSRSDVRDSHFTTVGPLVKQKNGEI